MSNNKPSLFPEVQPWPSSVDGHELACEILKLINDHVICDQNSQITTTLWVLHTWLIDAFDISPILNITAPMPNCGKSTLLDILEMIVNKPIKVDNISPAAVYRTVDRYAPTLLIDEVDAFIKGNEDMRGIINSGHKKNGRVIRAEGNNFDPTSFSTFCPKALCGIGSMANTLSSRSIKIELRRKLPNESTQNIRHIPHELVKELSSKLCRFSDDSLNKTLETNPAPPEGLNNRTLDNWEPLITIAQLLGDNWLASAYQAAMQIESQQGSLDLTTELLRDIKKAFEIADAEKISTSQLLDILHCMEETPWNHYDFGRPINDRKLANQLKRFKISSKNLRLEEGIKKGYKLEDFHDAFLRYLPSKE